MYNRPEMIEALTMDFLYVSIRNGGLTLFAYTINEIRWLKKQTEEKMEKCVSQLKKDLATVRTGRANPMILEKVVVDYYGAPTGLRQLAQVSVAEGTTLVITPFDKSIIKEIEKAT